MRWVMNRKATNGDSVAEILMYEEIGYDWWTGGGITAKALLEELDTIDVSQINVRINSPGGDAWEGSAIYNALRRHDAAVATYIDGIALSAASVVAMAGDTVVMAPNALMMIHEPWGMTMGVAGDHRKTAEMLDRTRDAIVMAYREKSGMPEAEIKAAMEYETWYTAQEALDLGLADAVSDSEVDVAASARFDTRAVARFRRTPTELVAALAAPPPRGVKAAASTAAGILGRNKADAVHARRVRELLTER